MQRTELELQVGPGGWVEVTISQGGEFWEAYLRLWRTDDGLGTPGHPLRSATVPPDAEGDPFASYSRRRRRQ